MPKRAWFPIAALVLSLVAARAARADDLDLLSTSLPPNLVFIFDTSGSMSHMIWHEDYHEAEIDPDGSGALAALHPIQIFWPSTCGVPLAADDGTVQRCPGSTYLVGSAIDGDTNLANDPCPEHDGGEYYYDGNVTPGCGGIYLPDYNSTDNTLWAYNYLNWLLPRLLDGDASNDEFPTDVRIDAARDVLYDVIDTINPDVVDDPNDTSPTYTERVRFGLARYRASDSAGGYITRGVASGNKASILSSVAALTASGSTPLSETLVDVGRYFAGTDLLCDLDDGTPCYGRYNRTTSGSTTTTWSSVPQSPVDLACRKNFVLYMTDGIPTSDQHTATYQANFGAIIGNYDLDGNECAPETGAQAKTCIDDPDDGRDDGFVYDSTGSDFLNDVAKYLYDYDLSTTLEGKQNIITYTLGFTLDHPLLSEAAAAGDGQYFTANSSDGLAEQITSAILDIIDRSSSFTAATVPSSRTTFGDGFYTAYFEPSSTEPVWEGHLEAYRLSTDGDVLDVDGDPAIDPSTDQFVEPRNPYWDAAELLADPNSGTRNLYTTLSSARAALSSATATDFGLVAGDVPLYPNYPDSGVADTSGLATALKNYLAGKDAFDEDADMDATELRAIVLGDVFHSNPVVVGPPATFLLKEAGYGSSSTSEYPFRKQWKQRDRVIYAGANDGMLHAFHAGDWYDGDNPDTSEVESGYYTMGTGAELFGYVPGLLLDEVKYVPRNTNHQYYFVDGSPTVADSWLGDPNDPNDVTKTPNEWASVLVAGFRQGGPGYLALDVTNPDATSSSEPHGPYPKLLWEFTHAQLGEAWSEPVITRVKTPGATSSGDKCGANDGDGDCRERWVAIFGGGYDDAGNPNAASFDAAETVSKGIFMVALDDGSLLASALYDPNASTDAAKMKYSIASMPAVLDLDFDGFADVVYVGDLGGQLWKWDISEKGDDSDSDGEFDGWSFGVFFDSGAEPLTAGGYHYRSIYFPAAASFVDHKLVMAFGTGERDDLFYAGSASEDENNRFYVIRDDAPTGASAFSASYTEADLSDITGLDSDTSTTDQGFFFVMQDAEKFVTNQLVFAGYVIAGTYLPDTTSSETCDRSGSAQLYVFDVGTGLGYYFDAGVTTGDGARFTTIGSGAPTDPRLSISMSGEQLYIQTSTGEVVQVDPPDPGSLARTIYWRHLY